MALSTHLELIYRIYSCIIAIAFRFMGAHRRLCAISVIDQCRWAAKACVCYIPPGRVMPFEANPPAKLDWRVNQAMHVEELCASAMDLGQSNTLLRSSDYTDSRAIGITYTASAIRARHQYWVVEFVWVCVCVRVSSRPSSHNKHTMCPN